MDDIAWMQLYQKTLAKMRRVNRLLDEARMKYEQAESKLA